MGVLDTGVLSFFTSMGLGAVGAGALGPAALAPGGVEGFGGSSSLRLFHIYGRPPGHFLILFMIPFTSVYRGALRNANTKRTPGVSREISPQTGAEIADFLAHFH